MTFSLFEDSLVYFGYISMEDSFCVFQLYRMLISCEGDLRKLLTEEDKLSVF